MIQEILDKINAAAKANQVRYSTPYNQPATAVVQQGAATAVSFNPLWIVGALAVVIVVVFVVKK